MSILNRIVLNVKANVNNWLEQRQDSEKLLEQVVEEMEQHLMSVRQGVAVAVATQKRTQRDIMKHQAIVNKYYQKAQLAIKENQEIIAKEALKNRYECQKYLEILESHYQQQEVVVKKLRQELRILEQKISEAKSKKNMYIARATTAKASMKIKELNGDVMGVNYNNAFTKMEEELWRLEAETDLVNHQKIDYSENQFSSLESENEIELELAKLKRQI